MAPSLHDRFRRAAEEFRRRFGKTCLAEALANPIAASLDLQANATGSRPANGATFLETAEKLLELLPESLSDRFYFDSWFLQSVCDGLQLSLPALPRPIPGYDVRGWGHWFTNFATVDGCLFPVSVVLFPGTDQLEDVALSDYPWLLHEIAHSLLAFEGGHMWDGISIVVRDFLRRRAGMGLAMRGDAADRRESELDKVRRQWLPRPGFAPWAEEIAADQVALWLGGNAFLKAFIDRTAAAGVQPHLATSQHPPYVVRASALVATSVELGLGAQANDLAIATRSWANQAPRGKDGASYHATFDRDLIEEVRQAIVRSLFALKIDRPWLGRTIPGAQASDINDGFDLFRVQEAKSMVGCSELAAWEKGLVRAIVGEIHENE